MAEMGLLANIERMAINEFKKDLWGFIRVSKKIDKSFSKSHSDVDLYLKKFESLAQSFNKKYKNLQFKLVKKISSPFNESCPKYVSFLISSLLELSRGY